MSEDLKPTHRYCGREGCMRCSAVRQLVQIYTASPALKELLDRATPTQRDSLIVICSDDDILPGSVA
jgi:hypothetical protein